MEKINISKVKFSNVDLLKEIKIPSELTEDLAEDIGIHVGDGSLYRTGEFKTFEFAYSSHVNEFEYTQHIKNLKERLYNIKKFNTNIKGNERRIRFNTLAVATFYSEIIGLPMGKKNNIDVPEIIKKCGDKNILLSFLRGIIDTDFCLVFGGERKYPILKAKFASAQLVVSLKKLFNQLGIKPWITTNVKEFDKRTNKYYYSSYIGISSKRSLLLALYLIKPRNSKYQEKIQKIMNGPAEI